MKINKTSWHYRFNKFVQDYSFEYRAHKGQFTTCSYIRTCIYSVAKALFISFLGAFVAGCIGLMLVAMVIVPIEILMNWKVHLVELAVVGWSVVALMLLALLCKQIHERYKALKRTYEQNVFVQSLIDRHNKFCTRVEVA